MANISYLMNVSLHEFGAAISNNHFINCIYTSTMWETLLQPLATFSKAKDGENNRYISLLNGWLGAKHLLGVSILTLKTLQLFLGASKRPVFESPQNLELLGQPCWSLQVNHSKTSQVEWHFEVTTSWRTTSMDPWTPGVVIAGKFPSSRHRFHITWIILGASIQDTTHTY